jgi:hypothetical protein
MVSMELLEELKGDRSCGSQHFAPVFNDIVTAYITPHGIDLTDGYEAENLSMAFPLISSLGGVSHCPNMPARCSPTACGRCRWPTLHR